MALVTVAADKRHLVDSKGRPFFAFGINYAGYFDRAWKMWESDLFDPDLIARDFRKTQHSGFNAVRLFVHSALGRDIAGNNFDKLDQTLSLAQDHELKVILSFNDAHFLNLGRVSELDAKIAGRYKDVPTIFAYDLENEPVFYNLVAAVYPDGYKAPVQTSQLVDHYGVRVSREEALDLQRNRRIPSHLEADKAFYYINALRLFLEYDRALSRFVNRGRGTIVDFMLSDEAKPWHTLIGVLDDTVDTWLRTRMDPVRATGCRQLLTVGWNWLHFASLPANRLLDFQKYHNYPGLSLAGFNTNVAHLQALRRAFPDHPVLFGEFGWSNQSGSNPATSQSISGDLTALYEAATNAYLRAHAFGGAFKWMLNDVDIAHNPYEASFGVFKNGDYPKPIRDLILRFSEDWPAVDQPGRFKAVRDLETGLSYRFDLPRQITVGGQVYQDETISWQAEDIAHCFIKEEDNELLIDAHGTGQLSIVPWEIIPGWDRASKADLYRVFSDSHRTRQRTIEAGHSVLIDVRPGVKYALVMGAAAPVDAPLLDDVPEVEVEPKPGEHVVLLGDADNALPAAFKYIRRFAPDITFAPAEVAGRWAYVTVIATLAQVPDELLNNIRATGATIVERVPVDSLADTEATLDDMASRGQRFQSAALPTQEEPPSPTPTPEEPAPEPPPAEPDEIYIVQPGDTLGRIAKGVYGEFRLWPLIFEANRDKISKPSLILVGMELLIPKRE
jgi:hypothetical protein